MQASKQGASIQLEDLTMKKKPSPFKNYNFPEELENASAVDQAEYIVRMGEDEYHWGVISEAREFLESRLIKDLKPKPKRDRGEPLPKRMRDLLTFGV